MSEEIQSIYYRSDTLVELLGPTDQANDSAITGATVSFRTYDTALDGMIAELLTQVRGNEAAAQTIISIPKIRPLPWSASDTIEITLNDGTLHRTTISGAPDTTPVDEDRITLAVALPSAANDGNQIRLVTKLGTVVPVDDAFTLFSKGDQVEVRVDSGARHLTTITQVQRATVQEGTPLANVADHPKLPDLVTLNTTLVSAASVRAPFLRQIGPGGSMGQFGTPLPNDENWGYRGTIAQDYADLELGMALRVEIDFSGGGVDRLIYFDAQVVRG